MTTNRSFGSTYSPSVLVRDPAKFLADSNLACIWLIRWRTKALARLTGAGLGVRAAGDLAADDLAVGLEGVCVIEDLTATFAVLFEEGLPLSFINAVTNWSFRIECQPGTPRFFAIWARSL